jgi:hypothetical protein
MPRGTEQLPHHQHGLNPRDRVRYHLYSLPGLRQFKFCLPTLILNFLPSGSSMPVSLPAVLCPDQRLPGHLHHLELPDLHNCNQLFSLPGRVLREQLDALFCLSQQLRRVQHYR